MVDNPRFPGIHWGHHTLFHLLRLLSQSFSRQYGVGLLQQQGSHKVAFNFLEAQQRTVLLRTSLHVS